MGCKLAVSSAITWFLDKVGEGIILEYDCLPSQSFFWFCQELLEKYRDDNRVMAINGCNCMFGQTIGDATYFFSKIPNVWGWATWKRAWKYWDGDLTTYPKFKEHFIMSSILHNRQSIGFYNNKFEQVFEDKDKTWGFPWGYAVFSQNGICATPNVNLISNIGFTSAATHATDLISKFANIPKFELDEIIHPCFMVPSLVADHYFTSIAAYIQPEQRVIQALKKIVLCLVPTAYHEKLKSIYRKIKPAHGL